jgi:hypothetical protein
MNGSASHPEFGDDEWHALRHQARNERDVAREAVQLGNNDWALAGAPCGQRCRELRAPVERICTLASFDLDELGGEFEPLSFGEALNGSPLGLDTEP